MLARLNHTRLLRYAGLFTWGLVSCWLLSIWLDPSYLQPEPGELPTLIDMRILRWLLVYLTFGAVYWWITRVSLNTPNMEAVLSRCRLTRLPPCLMNERRK